MTSIADRRAVMIAAMQQPEIRALLWTDPRTAVARVATPPADDTAITLIEETPDAWEFVVPAGAIDADLPVPTDPRSVVENDVYGALRDDPAVRDRVIADPKAFLAERFGLDIGPAGVNVREEAAGELLIVLPHSDGREELSDDALDLVAGGGQIGCQTGKSTSSGAGENR